MKVRNLILGNIVVGVLEGSVPSTALGLGTSTICVATLGWMVSASEATDDMCATTFATPFGFMSSFGTNVAVAGLDKYGIDVLQQLNTTQAYMESLNYEELEDMIAKLETKEADLSFENIENAKNTKNKRI